MTTVYTQKGEPLQLGDQLGAPGGEGTTYRLQRDPSLCAKIYHSTMEARKLTEMRRKLEVMIAVAPSDPTLKRYKVHSFAWPQQLLFADKTSRNFCGFIMPTLDLDQCKQAAEYIDFTGRRSRWTGTWEHLLAAVRNFASVVEAMHQRQHVLGDINDKNLFIGTRGLVSLIDCDSFQISNPSTGEIFRCNVGMDEYQPPEHSAAGASVETDRFALAVLIFRLLMQGTHPYAARGSAVEHASSSKEKIQLGNFPYQTTAKDIEPPPHALPFELLPRSLRKLFLRCFQTGNKNPQVRPTAAEWKKAIDQERKRLSKCRKNKRHVYTRDLWRCPWCEQVAQGKLDPFPDGSSSDAHQVPVATSSRWERLIHPFPSLSKTGFGTPPEMKLDNVQSRFLNVSPGQIFSGRIQLSNVGGGILEGSITASKPWISLGTNKLDRGRHRQEIDFQVNTSRWLFGMQDQAVITIASNGGTEHITVSVSIESPAPARKRLQTHIILPAVFIFALASVAVPLHLHRLNQGIFFATNLALLAALLFSIRSFVRKRIVLALGAAAITLYLCWCISALLHTHSNLASETFAAFIASVGMGFALFSALMLLENRLLVLTQRRRGMATLGACGTAVALLILAFVPSLLKTTQTAFADTTLFSAPSSRLSLCQHVTRSCNCAFKSSFRAGESMYFLLTGPQGTSATGYAASPDGELHVLTFPPALEVAPNESCATTIWHLNPGAKPGIYSGQLQITEKSGEQSTTAFNFSVNR